MTNLDSLADLATCSPGDQVSFAALVTDIKLQTTTTGKDYARLYIRDDKAAISIPFWNDTVESLQTAYELDKIYSFTAYTDVYKNSICLKKILSATEILDETINRRIKQFMYKHATPENIAIILAAVNSLKDTPYGPYLTAIYGEGTEDDPLFEKLKRSYASINHHDNYPGGYLNHVGGMLHIAGMLNKKYLGFRCESQWLVDWKFITAAIMLHDIGKLQTYVDLTDYTIRFNEKCLLDHNKIGVGMLYMINDKLPEDKRCSYEIFQQLNYTICYHDTVDKPYEHKRMEDVLISYIDGLESTLAIACSLEV